MFSEFHFLRPAFLALLIPLVLVLLPLWRKAVKREDWDAICDAHLLPYLIESQGNSKQYGAFLCFLLAGFFMSMGLSGPTWTRLPTSTFQVMQPRILLLDMSDSMLKKDIEPNRLTRAKFKLQDALDKQPTGQWGFLVYTDEPFVVSPLTEDVNTITALLPSLTPDIMPVGGRQLAKALAQAARLIADAGFSQGQLLVLTGEVPDNAAINEASLLAKQGITTSVLPVIGDKSLAPFFNPLAKAGRGLVLSFSHDGSDLDKWLAMSNSSHFTRSKDNNIPLWRDEGRWFIVGALLALLPACRRDWLLRV